MKDFKKQKKYVFSGSERDYALLRIRLRYDSLTQSEFFRMLVKKYIEKDLKMIGIVEDYKIQNTKMSLKKIKRATMDIERSFEVLANAELASSEKEEIFDLIETGPDWDTHE